MWNKLRRWVDDSETIAWARVQALIGFLANILTFVDPGLVVGIIPPEYVHLIAVYMLLNGLATEYLRRRRADDL